jgi:myosin heavy subunit
MEKPRVGSILQIAALVLAVLAAANFFLARNAERAKRMWAESELTKVTAAKQDLEKERDELMKAKEAVESQLTDTKSQAERLAEEVAQEKRAREALTTELAQARREATDVKGRLETERREKLTLTEELAKAKQGYQSVSNELTTLRQAKEALERRVKEMLAAQAAEPEKIVVKPAPGAAPTAKPAAEGKVLVVNREFNFVVVNLGSKDGLKTGTQLAIYRGDKMVGRAQVERLYDNMVAATLLSEEQKGQVQEGDLIRVF